MYSQTHLGDRNFRHFTALFILDERPQRVEIHLQSARVFDQVDPQDLGRALAATGLAVRTVYAALAAVAEGESHSDQPLRIVLSSTGAVDEIWRAAKASWPGISEGLRYDASLQAGEIDDPATDGGAS